MFVSLKGLKLQSHLNPLGFWTTWGVAKLKDFEGDPSAFVPCWAGVINKGSTLHNSSPHVFNLLIPVKHLLQAVSYPQFFPKSSTFTSFTRTGKNMKKWNSTSSAILHLSELGTTCRKESRALRCCKYASSWALGKLPKRLGKDVKSATCMPKHLVQ